MDATETNTETRYDQSTPEENPTPEPPSPTAPTAPPAVFGSLLRRHSLSSNTKVETLDPERAQRIINKLTSDPSWLADPRTAHAANGVFSAAAKVVGMHIEMGRLSNQTMAAKTSQALVEQQIKMASELASANPEAAAQFFKADENGNLPVSDIGNFATIAALHKKSMPAEKAQSTFGKLLADRAAASEADRPLFDQQIAAMGAKEGISIQFDDQGRPIINYGPGATGIGKPTVAVQTQAQQKMMKYENSMELMTQLENGLKPEHVGIKGAAGELLLDRTLAQFVPGAADTNRIEARTALIAAKEGLMREISDDPRFSNRDRDEISKALPSSGVFESYPDAMTRISTVKQILSNRGRVYSSGLGLKPPIWSMSKDEIKDAYQKKELTEDEAIKALQRFHRE